MNKTTKVIALAMLLPLMSPINTSAHDISSSARDISSSVRDISSSAHDISSSARDISSSARDISSSGHDIVSSTPDADKSTWYAGVQGGIPLAMSTASNFGGDKTRLGWSVGVFFGRHFSNIISAEIHASRGKTGMSPRECCAIRDNWIGLDGCHYFAPVLDMDCLHYDAIMSKVTLQDYGMNVNVSLLPVISSKPSRWNVMLSPGISACGTKASIRATADDSEFFSCSSEWHLGLSCRLHVGYEVSPLISVGAYTGITYVTGEGIDGLPRYYHSANTIWESGLRLTYNFKKGGR